MQMTVEMASDGRAASVMSSIQKDHNGLSSRKNVNLFLLDDLDEWSEWFMGRFRTDETCASVVQPNPTNNASRSHVYDHDPATCIRIASLE